MAASLVQLLQAVLPALENCNDTLLDLLSEAQEGIKNHHDHELVQTSLLQATTATVNQRDVIQELRHGLSQYELETQRENKKRDAHFLSDLDRRVEALIAFRVHKLQKAESPERHIQYSTPRSSRIAVQIQDPFNSSGMKRRTITPASHGRDLANEGEDRNLCGSHKPGTSRSSRIPAPEYDDEITSFQRRYWTHQLNHWKDKCLEQDEHSEAHVLPPVVAETPPAATQSAPHIQPRDCGWVGDETSQRQERVSQRDLLVKEEDTGTETVLLLPERSGRSKPKETIRVQYPPTKRRRVSP
ncbi:hypothetical protein B0H11DRAFT_2045324 [Mycena galericulata]|nr:hypothetical protein B0H11DRAFT_2106621 [Mycena galericulata]KAJ7468927.1 hypothetical protein B0H11DRAFT_2045324 [Mycena galericulata]